MLRIWMAINVLSLVTSSGELRAAFVSCIAFVYS